MVSELHILMRARFVGTFQILIFVWLSVLVSTELVGADRKTEAPKRPSLPEFQRMEMRPLLVTLAKEAGISVEGIAVPNGREQIVAGDTVTLLATVTEKQKNAQWVFQLKAVEFTAAERGEVKVSEFFSSSGNSATMSSAMTAVEVTVLGPVGVSGKPATKVRRMLVQTDAISMGLWGSVAANLKRREVEAKLPAGSPLYRLNFDTKPFPQETIVEDRKIAELYKISAKDERAMMATVPALTQFFQLIMSTPELSKMMLSVADVSMWTIAKSITGMTANIQTIPFDTKFPAAQWSLLSTPDIYVMPLEVLLNDKLVLWCQLALIPPAPPFQTSAGLVGLSAGQPNGKGPRLDVQLVSAKLAETVPESAGAKP